MSRPIGVDLFSGAGGLSLGFEQAGFDVVAAIEIDPIHAAVHKFNFPQSKIIARSISEITGDEIRDLAGIKGKPVDVVFGGAPCQGFSMMGRRALDDPRNFLVKEFLRLVCELKARQFVFENVKGLTQGKHKKFLEELIGEFKKVGYQVRTEWRVLNACNYGVPQDRQRLFLLGARNGEILADYPSPTTRKASDQRSRLPESPTCFDALQDLPDAESFDTLRSSDEVTTTRWGVPSAYAKLMRCQTKEGWGYGYKREYEEDVLTSSLRTEHSPISRRRFAETLPGQVEPISRFLRLPKNGVSNTLRVGTDSARGAFTSPRPIHYRFNRCITVREMARLHGFPDWFRFHETKWHGARQIGNAVPPPLARAVASEVMKALGSVPEKPSLKMKLGDQNLLRVGMNEAALHFSIPSPIGKRNLKSGIKKRKQHEIEAERIASLKSKSTNLNDLNLINRRMR